MSADYDGGRAIVAFVTAHMNGEPGDAEQLLVEILADRTSTVQAIAGLAEFIRSMVEALNELGPSPGNGRPALGDACWQRWGQVAAVDEPPQ